MARKKRGAGEGTIFRRADGRWSGTISIGFRPDGRRDRRTVYGASQTEVQKKLDELKGQRKGGSASLAAGKETLAGYLLSWLTDDVALNKSPKTFVEYDGTVRNYIAPFLGTHKLVRLSGQDLVSWQAAMSRRHFSPNARLKAIRVLRVALNRAVKLRLIPFSPMAAVSKPKVVRKETRPLELDECRRLMAACESHRIGDLIILAAMTGLRKGELFALEWSAVNLSESVLVVRQSIEETSRLRVKEPKTRAGRRVVSLGSEAVAALRRRLAKALDEGFNPDQVPVVFPNWRGGYLRGSNFDRAVWYPIREAAGIPDTFKFHDLRHTQASLLLAAGVDLKVIQKRLGHADFATTANIYAHLLQNAESDGVARLDDLMRRQAAESER